MSLDAMGLRPEDLSGSFDDFFEVVRPRLAYRADGFRKIFDRLKTCSLGSLTVETGCLRSLGNWNGDGQSTYLFDLFSRYDFLGRIVSIEISIDNIKIAKSVCPNTRFFEGIAASVINRLVKAKAIGRIDLLYLDSFDYGRDVSVIPAPVHYMTELAAAWPALGRGSLVAIDDARSPEGADGTATKALGVDVFMSEVGAEVIHDGYQKIWVVR